MKQYLNLMQDVLDTGDRKLNRTGTDSISVFGRQLRFDMNEGFPLLTTKKLHWKSIVHELLWFISGDTNTKYLNDNGVRIWNEWADERGNLGPVYGYQWRRWPKDMYAKVRPATFSQEREDVIEANKGYIDQLQQVIAQIIKNPYSRRHIVSAWNPSHLPDERISPQENVALDRMALAPCHVMFQFNVTNNSEIDILMYQRSVDVFLGLPFNIASYALLLHMVSIVTALRPRYLIWTGGDVHLYVNHLEQAKEQLKRTPKSLPKLIYTGDIGSIDSFKYEDFILSNYTPDPHIKGEIAI